MFANRTTLTMTPMTATATTTRQRDIFQIFCTIAGILLLKSNYYEFSESVKTASYGNTSAHLFRFRDFEPRFAGDVAATTRSAGGTTSDPAAAARKPRGFQFHADRKDITIDIEFTVPFVRIPLERSMELTSSVFRNIVNLNKNSLLASGAFVAVGAAVVGILRAIATAPATINTYGYKNAAEEDAATPASTIVRLMEAFNLVSYGRHANGSRTTKSVNKVSDFMSSMESKLHDAHDFELSTCIQRSICNYVRKAAAIVRSGQASGTEKIVDGLANLELVRSYLSGTAVQSAVDNGRNSSNCDYVYRSCKWSQTDNGILQIIVKYFNG